MSNTLMPLKISQAANQYNEIPVTFWQIVYIYMTAISPNLISWPTYLLTWFLHSFKMDLDLGTQWKKKLFFYTCMAEHHTSIFFRNKYSTSTPVISNYGHFKPDNSGPTDFEILRDDWSVLTMI